MENIGTWEIQTWGKIEMYRETVGSDSLNFVCKFVSKGKHFLKFDVHCASGKKK